MDLKDVDDGPEAKKAKLEIKQDADEDDLVAENAIEVKVKVKVEVKVDVQADDAAEDEYEQDKQDEDEDELMASDSENADVAAMASGDNGSESASNKKSNDEVVGSICKEEDVGITEYISKHEGFNAVIKQRYSDFLVNEIDINGAVVRLTNFDLPRSVPGVSDKHVIDVSEVLSAKDVEKLDDLKSTKDRKLSVSIKVSDDKQERTRIHTAIKQCYPALDSRTLSQGEDKQILVTIRKSSDNCMVNWPRGHPDYLSFVLYKENKDTMDSVSFMARLLRVKPGTFQYAGTKDKRAKTSQRVTAFRMTAEKLKRNNRNMKNVRTGNFEYTTDPLKLGYIVGNKFTIVLRNVTSKDDSQIQTAMKSLSDVGFINYYGMQRFGTQSIPTHHIGRALLRCEWQAAVELILQPRSTGDDPKVAAARKMWWDTRDCESTLKQMPHFCSIERAVLHGLLQYGHTNYKNALNKIPRNTRLMYVHSYQSYVWNSMVSRRINEFGIKPRVGDLYMPEVQEADDEGYSGRKKPDDQDDQERQEPLAVDWDIIDRVSMQDIVLPLPGYSVMYPQNCESDLSRTDTEEESVKSWYSEMMKKDGLDIDNMRHSVKEYSLSGTYRKILVKPWDLRWDTLRYDDVSQALALSDLDKMDKVPKPTSEPDGKFLALKMELSLPSSSYATMAIREVLKTETSSAYQSTLNVT